jgi:hypothetical protein
MMQARFYKPLLLFLALAMLAGASLAQKSMNQARADLGLTRVAPLENAPPMLAFTTVALGGFRGLIANALWVRAMDLQDDGKYFEMVQLADWITKLQPHLPAVWVVQAWNMAYNISIKFQDPRDRWLWVERGISLLRDDGLRWNPQETSLYRELAWFFQHKIGQNMDDAHLYYKQIWAQQMIAVLGNTNRVDFDALIKPQTEDQRSRAKVLRETYKMDPVVMRAVDARYGPLDWRLPESHAIYWAWLGLEKARKEELITLRRVIYQSMQLAFQRGRLISSKHGQVFSFGPNLDIVENANRAYEDMMEQDPEERDHITRGHRNFLRDAVYFLYTNNRMAEAARWFAYLGRKYPSDHLLDGRLETLPGRISLDDYALGRVTEDVGETSVDRTKMVLRGLYVNYFNSLALGFSENAANYEFMARKVYLRYEKKIEGQERRVGLPDLSQLKKEVLDDRLGPSSDLPPEIKAQLRTELGLPSESSTNAPPASVSTNTPAQ